MQKWLKRNPTEAGIFAIAGAILLFNLGGIKDMMAEQAMNRASVAANNRAIQQQQITQEAQDQLAEIANKRYDAQCEMVLSVNVVGHYKALSLHSPVLDGNVAQQYKRRPLKQLPLNALLPAGSTVCDSYGNTAILETNAEGVPVVLSLATTTDKERIRKAMERVKATQIGGLN